MFKNPMAWIRIAFGAVMFLAGWLLSNSEDIPYVFVGLLVAGPLIFLHGLYNLIRRHDDLDL